MDWEKDSGVELLCIESCWKWVGTIFIDNKCCLIFDFLASREKRREVAEGSNSLYFLSFLLFPERLLENGQVPGQQHSCACRLYIKENEASTAATAKEEKASRHQGHSQHTEASFHSVCEGKHRDQTEKCRFFFFFFLVRWWSKREEWPPASS